MPLRPNSIQFSPLSHLTCGSSQLKSPKCPGLPPLLCYKPEQRGCGPRRVGARSLPLCRLASPGLCPAAAVALLPVRHGDKAGEEATGSHAAGPSSEGGQLIGLPTAVRQGLHRSGPGARLHPQPRVLVGPALLRRGAPPLDLQPAPRLLPSLVMIQSSATLTSST
jgi:hypothetical protein